MSNNQHNPGTPKVEANVKLAPVILATMVSMAAIAGGAIFLTRHLDEKKRKELEEAKTRKEEDATLPPPMPMMWPAAKQAEKTAALESQIESLTARLDEWHDHVERQEEVLEAQSRNLQLVMGGDEE